MVVCSSFVRCQIQEAIYKGDAFKSLCSSKLGGNKSAWMPAILSTTGIDTWRSVCRYGYVLDHPAVCFWLVACIPVNANFTFSVVVKYGRGIEMHAFKCKFLCNRTQLVVLEIQMTAWQKFQHLSKWICWWWRVGKFHLTFNHLARHRMCLVKC